VALNLSGFYGILALNVGNFQPASSKENLHFVAAQRHFRYIICAPFKGFGIVCISVNIYSITKRNSQILF